VSTILDKIVANRIQEVEVRKQQLPLFELKNRIDYSYHPLSLRKALLSEGASGIIAEFKRQSPSKGIINDKVSPEIVTKGYAENGASGLSVLTEEKFFGGSAEDLKAARLANPLTPILRKDFIVDEYQIYESRMLKADVILLIAAVLDKETISAFTTLAHELGMEVLLELHDENELEKIDENVDLIGINNRNLKDFSVDIDRSLALLRKLPEQMVKISESGLNSPETILHLMHQGFKGFLMGESFMKAKNPGKAFNEFLLKLTL
jgi:indole-3-glycerol phosphate synthase